jgi:hypothetical protein
MPSGAFACHSILKEIWCGGEAVGGGTPQAAATALVLSLEMKTIAKLSGELPGVVPVRPAKGIRAVEQVARIADVLRGE